MTENETHLVAEHDGCHFEIQEVRPDGFYVWRFIGQDRISTHDYLQDDLPMALRCAHQWGVPDHAWKPVGPENPSRLRTVDNQTLQRTGAPAKRSWIQKLLFGRGPGR